MQSLIPIRREIQQFKNLSVRLAALSNRVVFITGAATVIALIEVAFFVMDIMSHIKATKGKGAGSLEAVATKEAFPYASVILNLVRLVTIFIIWNISRPRLSILKRISGTGKWTAWFISILVATIVVFCVVTINLARVIKDMIVVAQIVLIFGTGVAVASLSLADRTRSQELESAIKFVQVQ